MLLFFFILSAMCFLMSFILSIMTAFSYIFSVFWYCALSFFLCLLFVLYPFFDFACRFSLLPWCYFVLPLDIYHSLLELYLSLIFHLFASVSICSYIFCNQTILFFFCFSIVVTRFSFSSITLCSEYVFLLFFYFKCSISFVLIYHHFINCW